MAEIAFEQFSAALESTRGTAIATPTHLVHQGGILTPTKSTRWAEEHRGTLAANYRSVVTRKGCEWKTIAEDADTASLIWWLNLFVAPVTTPTTPSGATTAKDWTFVRSLTSDNLKSFTGWFGDPNVQTWKAGYCVGTELTLKADATADDGVLAMSAKGLGQPMSKASAPTVPAAIAGPLLPAQFLECWIDTTSAIGTTPITGRVLSAEHTIRTGVTTKTLGGGPTASLGYSAIGRQQVSAITTKVRLELFDTTQYDLWDNHTSLKLRMRYSGPAIETVTGPATLYHHVEVDTYGPFETLDWGENAGTNRVIELAINGAVDATLASDLRVQVRNTRTAL